MDRFAGTLQSVQSRSVTRLVGMIAAMSAAVSGCDDPDGRKTAGDRSSGADSAVEADRAVVAAAQPLLGERDR